MPAASITVGRDRLSIKGSAPLYTTAMLFVNIKNIKNIKNTKNKKNTKNIIKKNYHPPKALKYQSNRHYSSCFTIVRYCE